jgi:hypothetical protein
VRFRDVAQEIVLHQNQRDRLDRARRREWNLGDLVITLYAEPNLAWSELDRCTTDGGFYIQYDLSMPGDSNHRIYRPSAEQLHRVALCVEVFERWCGGEIDELPTDPPEGARKALATFAG